MWHFDLPMCVSRSWLCMSLMRWQILLRWEHATSSTWAKREGVKWGPTGVRPRRLSSNNRITSRNKCHAAILVSWSSCVIIFGGWYIDLFGTQACRNTDVHHFLLCCLMLLSETNSRTGQIFGCFLIEYIYSVITHFWLNVTRVSYIWVPEIWNSRRSHDNSEHRSIVTVGDFLKLSG